MDSDEQLREQAERRIGSQPDEADERGAERKQPPETQEHELQVHRIELEIQNEELRRANQQLEQAHHRYADLFEFAPVGYAILDHSGVIQQINLTGCQQLGAPRSHLTGRRFSLFVEVSQRAAFTDLLGQVFETAVQAESAAPHRRDLPMLRQDGSTWDAQIECVALPDLLDWSRPLARATLTDISALKRSQREVERLNETLEQQIERRTFQAQQLHEELQIFVYSVAHDMTRPLRQIQGFSELLTRNYPPSDERSARYLDHLKLATTQMGGQMTALLAFFQSSQPLNQPQPLDLNRLIEGIIQELAPELQGRRVQLTHDPLPTIEADQQSVSTIFSNLISNAVKFTRPRSQAIIHVGVQEEDDTYLFSVHDNGVGFDQRTARRLFGLFQRLHSERDFEGQGMGLALVRRIVQRYQGRVWAESVLDQGAVFWVKLPKNPSELLDAW
ncbi:sensor histidine kinase [Deinococcus sp.]|uniref:sensor histidine kinase n=1 Tax=Deinococcus sp. TaxID=47478 RepID=UPI003CC54A17